MAKHNDLGELGELAACEFLKKQGYSILHKNWRYRRFEIDIIARQDRDIVFIEVKTRSSDHWENPEEAVSSAKIKRIIEAADFYIKENDIALDVRFDIIAAIWNGKQFIINHIDDAFYAPLE